MATIRVRSTDGNDADDGSSFPLAKATLTGAAAIDAAGDTIAVSSVHAETSASALSFSWAGTAAAPTRILSVDDSADPPTALLPGATITTTGASDITLVSSDNNYTYFAGLTFNCGDGAVTASIRVFGKTFLDRCNLFLNSTAGLSSVSNTTNGESAFYDCNFRFGSAGHGFSISSSGIPTRILGGGVSAGGVSIDNLVRALATGAQALFDGFDLGVLAATVNMVNDSGKAAALYFRNCILPASWTGSLNPSTPGNGSIFEMFSCWSGATEIIWRRKTQFGEGRDETTLVRTGGGKHRGVGVSLKCDTTANAKYPSQVFDTLQFAAQVTAAQVGSPVTATVEILHDSATALTDADIWLTVVGPGSEVNSDQVADVFATPANQATSSETWTTTGMANPNTQKLTVTWTPAKAGVVLGTVSIAAPSKTVYADNMMTVAP